MKWGDVLCAAIDACQAAGPDEPVTPEHLPRLVMEILEVRGGMDATYAAALTKETTDGG